MASLFEEWTWSTPAPCVNGVWNANERQECRGVWWNLSAWGWPKAERREFLKVGASYLCCSYRMQLTMFSPRLSARHYADELTPWFTYCWRLCPFWWGFPTRGSLTQFLRMINLCQDQVPMVLHGNKKIVGGIKQWDGGREERQKEWERMRWK